MNNIIKDDAQTITLDQLLPGDILVFKTVKGDPLDDIITCLTNDSDVSHGALFVQQKDFVLADSAASGIGAHAMSYNKKKDNDVPRDIYVLRHNKAGQEGLPSVAAVAGSYVSQKLLYPFSDLILLAMILLFRKEVKKSFISNIVVDFFIALAAEIKTKIEERDGKHTMICSSFVYQCFMDAADQNNDPSLNLDVKNGDVGFEDCHLLGNSEPPSNSLIELYADYATKKGETYKNNFCANRMQLPIRPVLPMKKILEKLKDVLLKDSGEIVKSLDDIDPQLVAEIMKAIGDVIYGLSVLKNDKELTFDEILEDVKKQHALFVTPNDLRYHLTNAEYIGFMTVYRDDDDYQGNLPKEITA